MSPLCFEIMCCHVLVWSTSLFSTCNIWIYTSLPFRKIFVNKKGKTQMLTSCKITFSGNWLLIILWNADQYLSIQIKNIYMYGWIWTLYTTKHFQSFFTGHSIMEMWKLELISSYSFHLSKRLADNHNLDIALELLALLSF